MLFIFELSLSEESDALLIAGSSAMKCFSYPGGAALSDTQRSRASGGSDIVFEAAGELKCQLELDGLATPPGGITTEARARFFRMACTPNLSVPSSDFS